jgi:acetyl-CoA carboxylase beta subunit
MIYHACIAGGCSVGEATVVYLGVRIGAVSWSVPQWAPALTVARSGPRVSATATEQRIAEDFRRAAEIVLAPGEVDNIDEIERRTDEALSVVTHQDLRSR